MKVVVVGSGGREHTIIKKIRENPEVTEVFALPGKVGDIYSEGCNNLIKTNKANLLTGATDIRYIMRWDVDTKVVAKQMRLFRDFSDDEKKVMNVFENSNVVHLDDIIVGTDLSPSKIASVLLSLEFDGVLTALPGKRYQKL